MYRDHPDFRDRDLDAPSNIEGLPGPDSPRGNIHSQMTGDWMDFARAHPNATGAQILDFANQMDAKYHQYIWQ
jgi:hypothetical protein